MRRKSPHLRFALLLGGSLSLSVAAAETKTDDLLTTLPQGTRREILNGIDARGACELRVLEKEFKIKFQEGAPATDPESLSVANCSAGRNGAGPNGIAAKVSSRSSLSTSEGRWNWLSSQAVTCELKRRLALALNRAATKLDRIGERETHGVITETGRFSFVTTSDILANRPCVIENAENWGWKKDLTSPICYTARENTAQAVSCFYQESCRMGCSAGAFALETLGAYELFAGEDGIMDADEKLRFQRYYDVLSIGPGGEKGIRNTPGKIRGSGARIYRASTGKFAAYGKFGLTGFNANFSPKASFAKTNQANPNTDPNCFSNLNQNFVILSTSEKGAKGFQSATVEGDTQVDTLVGESEKDLLALRNAINQLPYYEGSEEVQGHPEIWGPSEQVLYGPNYKAIADGTFKFYNLPASGTPERARTDAAIAEIRRVFAKPIYRDTMVRLQPHGIMPLGQVPLYIFSCYRNAPVSLSTPTTAENQQFGYYLSSLIDECMGE